LALAPLVLLVLFCFMVGSWSGLVVGFFWSTVFVYHATFCINSLAHAHGRRRYVTGDDSRNNWLLALFTMGEGWHNNHHAYQSSAQHGFRWWESDATFYVLKALSCGGRNGLAGSKNPGSSHQHEPDATSRRIAWLPRPPGAVGPRRLEGLAGPRWSGLRCLCLGEGSSRSPDHRQCKGRSNEDVSHLDQYRKLAFGPNGLYSFVTIR
jgi:hypothetical protein